MNKVALAFALMAVTSLAQTTADSAALQSLAGEMRQLRLAVERAVFAMPRVQLLLHRVQIQEQKIMRLSDQLADVRRQVARASSEQARMMQAAEGIETRIGQEQDPRRRKELEDMRADIKGGLERDARLSQQLQSQEADLAAAIRSEEAKLDELLQRWTALERSLEAPAGAR